MSHRSQADQSYDSRVVAAYKAGKATSEIAADVGGSRRRVLRALKRNGIEIIKARMPLSYRPHNKLGIEDTDIVACHNRGLSSPEIASELRCPKYVISQRLRKLGLRANAFKFGRATNLVQQIGVAAYERLSDRQWLVRQYVELNKTTRVIASQIGCGKRAVSSALKRHNIPLKRSRRGVFKSSRHKSKDFWFDSYWEFEIATRLDEDPAVLKFIKEPFPLHYLDQNNKSHRYYPDFLVVLTDGRVYLLEVKPDGLLPYVQHKIRAASKCGLNFCVLNQTDTMPWAID